MKRMFVFILMIALAIQMVGCGSHKDDDVSMNDGQKNTPTTSDDDKDNEVTLVVWGGVPAESGPQGLVDEWNLQHPDIQVDYVRFVNDDTGNTKLETAMLSGEQIDLFFNYSTDKMKKRVEGGMVEPLEQYGAEEFIKNNVVGAGDGQIRINNQLYGIPTAKEPIGFMLNKEMLEGQGVTIPEDWTIEDFRDVSAKLTHEKDGHKVYGTHGYYSELPLNFALTVLGGDHMYKADGKASNFDSPEFEINASVKELMDNGYAMPYEEVFSRKLEAYCHPAFLNEEVAMMPFSAWMLRYVKDLENYPHEFITTFASYPTIEEGVVNNYQAYLNNHLSISSESQHKEEAWEFLKYWVTDGSRHMLNGGKIPVWNQISEEEVLVGILGENAEELFDVESFKKVMFNPDMQYIVDTITTAYPQVMQIYKEESEMYFLNSTTKEEYLNNLKTRADEVIASELN